MPYGAKLAFCRSGPDGAHPDVDLVTVSVKVPDHYTPVMAAIDAGKHVYCEWPLGRNTDEAVRLLDAAERRGVRHAVGLQGQMSPAINYVKDLIADGYVGQVLTATMIGCAPNWGASIDRAYQADRTNGANLMTITGGHQIDALCYCLGEFRELPRSRSASAPGSRSKRPANWSQRTSPDQLLVNGIVGGRNSEGAVVSFQIRGGMTRGTEFLFEVHGDRGRFDADRHNARLDATPGADRARRARQRQGSRRTSGAGKYRWVPEGLPGDSRYNVAQLYARLAESIRDGKPASPELCRRRDASPPARRDHARLRDGSEAGAADELE